MNGPGHYAEAERLLDVFKQVHIDAEGLPDATVEQFEKRAMAISTARVLLDKAQVHAMLAQVAATANLDPGEGRSQLAPTPSAWDGNAKGDAPTWESVTK